MRCRLSPSHLCKSALGGRVSVIIERGGCQSLCIALGSVVLLSACLEEAQSVDAAIAEIDALPAAPIEPLAKPALDTLSDTIYHYSAQDVRSPFALPSSLRQTPVMTAPNLKEPISKQQQTVPVKQGLERYELESLRYRGRIAFNTDMAYGLIETPDGLITRVQVGDKLGSYAGRITAINANQIELTERMPNQQQGFHTQTVFLKSSQ